MYKTECNVMLTTILFAGGEAMVHFINSDSDRLSILLKNEREIVPRALRSVAGCAKAKVPGNQEKAIRTASFTDRTGCCTAPGVGVGATWYHIRRRHKAQTQG